MVRQGVVRSRLEELTIYVEDGVAEQDDYAVCAMLPVWVRLNFLVTLRNVTQGPRKLSPTIRLPQRATILIFFGSNLPRSSLNSTFVKF